MSDAGFGSPEQPYVEMPLAGYSASVHWHGGTAVQWKQAHMVYIDPLRLVPSSPFGVLSMWVKFPDGAASSVISFVQSELIQFAFGFGGAYDAGGGRPFGSITVNAIRETEDEHKEVWLQDANAELNTYNRWYHIYAEWDTNAGSLVLQINGRPVSTTITQGFDVLDTWGGTPISMQWDTPAAPAPPAFPQTTFFWTQFSGISPPDPVRYSIAALWLDPGRHDVGVEKFVDLATGKPKALGANGQIPTGTLPAFYFARSGAPKTILDNRGYGGVFKFARTQELTPLNPDIDGPLHEPEEPHFVPVADPAPPVLALVE